MKLFKSERVSVSIIVSVLIAIMIFICGTGAWLDYSRSHFPKTISIPVDVQFVAYIPADSTITIPIKVTRYNKIVPVEQTEKYDVTKEHVEVRFYSKELDRTFVRTFSKDEIKELSRALQITKEKECYIGADGRLYQNMSAWIKNNFITSNKRILLEIDTPTSLMSYLSADPYIKKCMKEQKR